MDNFKTLVYDEVTSTNKVLKQMAISGEREGTVIIAKKQTEGRGRLGRSFFSPEDTGLYMSVLLRPEADFEKSFFVTPMTAVAVVRALKALGAPRLYIKWVNDIFCNGKKVSGILAEGGIDECGHKYIVLGVGINLFKSEFPDEIKNIAGAVFDCDEDVSPKKVADAFLNEFWMLYKNPEDRTYIDEYRQMSMLTGKNVTLLSGDKKRCVKAIDIDNECRLVIENEDGEKEVVLAGEVSVLW